MVEILLLRHAQTSWNEVQRIQGHTDMPLSAGGRAMAVRWRLPAGARGMVWVSSPLMRCLETARQIGVSAKREPRLIEMSWGEWEGRTLDELRSTGVLTDDMEALGLDFRAPGGESPRQVQERVTPWLVEVAAQGRPTAAVTHHGVIRAIYALATGWDMADNPPDRLQAGCAHRIVLDPHGRPSVDRLNIGL